MSKKSRRRNKKILAALALAGGAAMLGKRGVPAAANVDSGRGSGLRSTVDSAKKADVVSSDSGFLPRVHPGTLLNKRGVGAKMLQRGAMNKLPPSMRGGADYAEGATTFMPANRQWPGGYVKGTFKKGGRVTGIAKRGFGRALMKGKK